MEHSRSPAMQRAALQAAGLEGTYEARRVDADGVRAAVDELRSGALDGANVTMPHKLVAAGAVDALDATATATGAVNTMFRESGRVVGANTDVAGIATLLATWDDGVGVIVLGAGGAARAALAAARGRPRKVMARDRDAAAALAAEMGADGAPAWGASAADWIVINATPLGMAGEELGVPLQGIAGLVDLAYGPAETPAVAVARRSGIRHHDGLDALVAQGAESFRLWTGESPDIAAMAKAVRDH